MPVRVEITGDFKPVAGHAGHAPRRAHELHFVYATFAQNLRAHAVGAQVHAATLGCLRRARRAIELRQQLLGRFTAVEQHGDAATGLADVAQTGLQAPGVHGTADFEGVEQRQRLVHPHRHAVFGRPLALDQRQVQRAIGSVAKSADVKFARSGVECAAADFLHQALDPAAVLDQVGNGADFQAVFDGEPLQVGQPGHAAVVVHDLADHGGGRAAGHGGEVAAGFSVTRAHQHAAVYCLQRENVAGLHQIVRPCARGDGSLHRARAVRRRNAGAHTLRRLYRYRECRAFFVAVARHHGRQLQVFAVLARQRQADQAAAKACHEVDGLRRHVVGRQHQVALVLAVFFVHQNHHAPSAQLGHDVGHG